MKKKHPTNRITRNMRNVMIRFIIRNIVDSPIET